MKVKIEKNVKIPENRKIHGNSKYPWADMKVGDSFAVEKPANSMRSQACHNGKYHGMKFTVHALSATSCRIWRVS